MTTPADRISDERLAEIEAGLEGVKPGPWQVAVEMYPWALPERTVMGETIPAKTGAHVERRIFTTWKHAQLKAPWPVVNGSVGVGDEKPVHMVHIDEADAAHIARCDPDTISAIITELRERRAQAVTVRPLGIVGNYGGIQWYDPPVRLGTVLYGAPPPAQSADAAKEAQGVAVAWQVREKSTQFEDCEWGDWHEVKEEFARLVISDGGKVNEFTIAEVRPLYASPPAPASGGVSEDDEEAFPTLREAYASALAAAELFYDAASVDEANWSGWGDQIIPPYAEMRRVKAKQALLALRDADPKMRAAITQPAGKE